MTGCLAATAGEVKIGGCDIFEEPEKAKKLIGYLPEQPPVYMECTPREYLTFVAQAKKIARKDLQKQISRVLAITQTEHVADRLIKNLSKGYRQRVGIAQALLGDPEVIILDEPTVGLDPRQIIEIRELISELGRDHTVILSSHILSEIQAVCKTILIINKGKLIACDTPENLEKRYASKYALELEVETDNLTAKKILSAIPRIQSSSVLFEKKGDTQAKTVSRLALEVSGAADQALCREIFFAFAEAKKAILELKNVKASLEDIFIQLTEKEA
jgi:ABC-2 type transport system ATP-binding protein